MPDPRSVHVAAISLDQTVGDWEGNADRVITAIGEARGRDAKLIVTPELCLSGYSLGDRVLRDGTLERSWGALLRVLPHTDGLVVFVGLPIRHRGVLYNGVAVLADRRVVGLCCKENLATGDVEYENRWYAGWPRGQVDVFTAPDGTQVPIGSLVFEADGIGRFAVEVCEDAWKGMRPGSISALAGATIVVNPSATWFVLGKQAMRRRMISQISDEDLAAYVFASLLGCDDTRLIFDGALLIAQEGAILAEGERFRFDRDHCIVDRVIDVAALARKRMVAGSWRQQVESLHRGEFGPIPEIVAVDGEYATPETASAPPPYWLRGLSGTAPDAGLHWVEAEGFVNRPLVPTDIPHLELELALSLAMRDYVKKTRSKGIALALSGGRDSTMCAVIVQRMLRYDNPKLSADALHKLVGERFTTVWMETTHSSAHTRNAATTVAAELGATHLSTNIQSSVDDAVAQTGALLGEPLSWANPKHDIPLQNVQARVRGMLVWSVANVREFILLTTSNLSECAVGYCTMDGDTCGGLAPIANVPKSLVSLWLKWAAEIHGFSSLQSVFDVPPTAELRPADRHQTDEDDLMPFVVLDQLMYLFVQRGQDPVQMFDALWPEVRGVYGGDPKPFAAHIAKFVRKMCQAQWKRERFAISFRVTAFDLDPKTGFRFPPVQEPFSAELRELEAHVAGL